MRGKRYPENLETGTITQEDYRKSMDAMIALGHAANEAGMTNAGGLMLGTRYALTDAENERETAEIQAMWAGLPHDPDSPYARSKR